MPSLLSMFQNLPVFPPFPPINVSSWNSLLWGKSHLKILGEMRTDFPFLQKALLHSSWVNSSPRNRVAWLSPMSCRPSRLLVQLNDCLMGLARWKCTCHVGAHHRLSSVLNFPGTSQVTEVGCQMVEPRIKGYCRETLSGTRTDPWKELGGQKCDGAAEGANHSVWNGTTAY